MDLPFATPAPWTEWKAYGDFITLTLPSGAQGRCHYWLSTDSAADASAPAVVLVHGIGEAGGARWEFARTALVAAGRRVLSFDFFGRGFSDCPAEFDFSGEAHVEQLRALLCALRLDAAPVILVGHSMGGAVSLLYTRAHPEHVAKLCLMAPAGAMDGGIFRFLRCCCCGEALLRALLGRGDARAIRDDFFDYRTAPLYEWAAAMQRAHVANNPARLAALVRSVRLGPLAGLEPVAHAVASDGRRRPVLIMWGSDDRVVPTRPCLERYRAAFRDGDARLDCEVYPRTSHAFFLEAHAIRDVHARLVAFCCSVENGASALERATDLIALGAT